MANTALAPPKMMLTNASVNSDNDIVAKISWDLPCGGVDKYTFYYLNGKGDCHNDTLSSNEKLHTVISASTIQIEAHRNDESVCSPGMYYLLIYDAYYNIMG